jgi:hypothetical protein
VSDTKQHLVGKVVWHGTLREQLDLIAAVQHNCGCDRADSLRPLATCSAHTMLARDQRALNGLLWTRHLAKLLLVEEGVSAP